MAIDRAQTLLRELGEENVPVEDAATVERRRRRVVAATALAIARAAKERERRERWTRLGVGIAAAAAIVAVAGEPGELGPRCAQRRALRWRRSRWQSLSSELSTALTTEKRFRRRQLSAHSARETN